MAGMPGSDLRIEWGVLAPTGISSGDRLYRLKRATWSLSGKWSPSPYSPLRSSIVRSSWEGCRWNRSL
ncbi:hypothetical protein CEXT_664121 [Caerostris extrusa]|uniref:Uncharacterized protein n=1 Tax=Caerostris extrusa TaxID=172846 RepID=A0AAV4XXI9_CAEEX|nr:hypothetical protein CEXT_664121 [Caerostris extrusa]